MNYEKMITNTQIKQHTRIHAHTHTRTQTGTQTNKKN